MRSPATALLAALVQACILHHQVARAEVILASAGNACPSGYSKITSAAACKDAGAAVETSSDYNGSEDERTWPSGCYHCDGVDECTDGTWFNKHATGSANGGARPYCTSGTSTGTSPTDGTTGGGGEDSKQRVLFMGDSDVEGWSTQAAFPGSSNVGVGGYTCNSVLNKVDTYMRNHNEGKDLDWVVLVCGENDMYGTSAAKTFARMKKVLAKLLAAGVKQVLYMGTKPEPDTKNLHAKYQQYDGLLRAHATTLAATPAATAAGTPPFVMVDVYPSFEALGNANNLYRNDKLHLSSKGYKHWNTWARQGKFQLLPPAPPYYPIPRGNFHTRGNIWSFTVG